MIVFSVFVSVNACADSGPKTIAGLYALRSIAGRALPTTSGADANVTYTSGTATLNADGSCSFAYSWTATGTASPQSASFSCTWTATSATNLTIDFAQGSDATALWSSRELALQFIADPQGELWIFRR